MSGKKGCSGGTRQNSGRKSKMTDEARAQWKHELRRAIGQAALNFFVLPRKSFWSTGDIRSQFGKPALEEFKSWFCAERHYNTEVAGELKQKLAAGIITEERFEQLIYTKAYFWVWSIRSERHREAHEIVLGEREL